MREVVINKNDAGQRLDKFMAKKFKTMPSSLLYKYVRRKCVKINGKRITDADTLLCEGDVVAFYISDEFFGDTVVDKKKILSEITPSFLVVYEDENIILMEKPVGLLCQADDKEQRNTLDNHLRAYLMKKGEYSPENEQSFSPSLCNRIDKNTHGIVIGAKNAESLRIMNDKIKNGELTKIYNCLVVGDPSEIQGKKTAYLKKDKEENHVHIIANPDKNGEYKKIVTEFSVLKTDGNISKLEVKLHTGKTHQIRAHLSFLGYPVLGDFKYGNTEINKRYPFRYQALSSCRLGFSFKTPSGILEYLSGKSFEIKPFFDNIIQF